MQLQGVDGSYKEQCGLVRISPSDIAKKVIKELNGSFLNKLQVTATEFFPVQKEMTPGFNALILKKYLKNKE